MSADKTDNPLLTLYKTLCNALLDDEDGINQTAYSALMILGDLVDKEAAQAIAAKIEEHDGRYRYRDNY